MFQSEKPNLVENGTQYFLKELLKQCHDVKMTYYNHIYNVGLFILFFFILSMFLIYRYKGKLSNEELAEKERERQLYILSKIKNYQSAKQRINNDTITGLPEWENEQEYVFRKVENS
tara:strand:- start:194 stop:544 length:351 start_codon:yes stop_codon:yes gene_type:complete